MADISNSTLLQSDTGIHNKDACIVIIKTEWNAAVVDELERGCIRALKQQEVTKICRLTVPGAFEIPFGIKAFWEATKYTDNRPLAFVALGCVIRVTHRILNTCAKALRTGSFNLTRPCLYPRSLAF